MAHSLMVCTVDVHQLAAIVRNRMDNALVLDSRSFLEYNGSHVVNAINVGCAKLMKRRLQQEKLCIEDFLAQNCHWDVDRSINIIVYDQNSRDARYLSPDSFMAVFLQKLLPVYNSVSILEGGFLEFQAAYPNLCEDERAKFAPLTSLSQPCLPISNHGPTRILPFLYLGSQHDALGGEILQHYNITYHLNVSTTCPKPDFIQDSHFMRIPVIDNYSEKLLPHFPKAFQFLDKVRESGGCVLVHCLAGISRSATVAIAYVMKTLKMTSDDAYRFVKAKRTSISPNFNFLGQLLEFEKQLKRDYVLDSKSEPSSVPQFNTSSPSGERQCQYTSRSELLQNTTRSPKCIPEIKSTKGSFTYGASETKTFRSLEQSVIDKLDTYTCIPEKPLNIKCLPISSLKELNFTSCHTSSFKSSHLVKDERKSGSRTPNSAVSPTRTVGMSLSTKRSEKRTDSFYIETHLGDFNKLESGGRSLNLVSPDVTTQPDLKAFDFDAKSYNRSDSVSTSGLGSEGSDYADSWNDFTSSCERESDIMDDDYPSVPTGEEELLRRNKMLGFDDSYEESLSLYPKYEPRYNPHHIQRQRSADYAQAVPSEPAKQYKSKYDKSSKYPGVSLTGHQSPDELGRAHLLYRAQSCPGMLSFETDASDDTENSALNNVKLRKPKPMRSSKDKYRNRYSCSSIDYMDYSLNPGLSLESCPDVLHLSAGSKSSKISSHCSYRHSMIQVS